jgi:thiol:disulfide interchange protein DsbC
MTRSIGHLLCVAAVLIASIGSARADATKSHADTAAATSEAAGDANTVLARLRKSYPGTRFDTIRSSEISGLYEVAMGRTLAYVEPQGRYFLFGHLYDLPGNVDLTADRASRLQSVAAGTLPPADGFTIRRSPTPTYRVSVFSDPQCGYCRTLETTLASLPDVEVTIYLLPLLPGSEERAASVWCAPDRVQAWQSMMQAAPGVSAAQRPPKQAKSATPCDTSVFARNKALATQLGIRGTPALIADDGRMQPGAMHRTDLLAWLSARSTVHLTEPVPR